MIYENESSIIICLDISSKIYKKHKRETSRFDFMESFINNNLAQIIKKNPNCKVGILIFGNKV